MLSSQLPQPQWFLGSTPCKWRQLMSLICQQTPSTPSLGLFLTEEMSPESFWFGTQFLPCSKLLLRKITPNILERGIYDLTGEAIFLICLSEYVVYYNSFKISNLYLLLLVITFFCSFKLFIDNYNALYTSRKLCSSTLMNVSLTLHD